MQKLPKQAVFKFDSSASSDILYRNLKAVRNRMDLLANFRLVRKDKLDYETLRGLRKPFVAPEKQSLCFITQSVHSNGDIDRPQPSKVVLKFSVDSLGLDEKEKHKLKLLAAEKCSGNSVEISCHRFPFAEQNKKWLKETFCRLLEEARNKEDTFEDVANIWVRPEKKEVPYPIEWLKQEKK